MIRVAIVDDDTKSKNILEGYTKKYAKESGETFSISLFSDGLDIAEEYKAEYDVIFLDVKMKFMDGMKAAEKIRELDSDVLLIFITNMTQYALKGYEVQAMNYLIKPITYFAFSQELQKACAKINERTNAYFYVRTDTGIRRLNVEQILYLESKRHQIIVHTETDSYATRDTMKNVESMLLKYKFVRCHNCFLVNLKYVDGVVQNQVIVKGEELAISRPRKKEFLDELTNYIGGVV
ncbi:MAG: LytR/AlgR family response regulator transcription factor [Lachnospiraceae bacterium]